MNNLLQTFSLNPLKLILFFIEISYFAINLCFAPENHYYYLSTRFCFSFLSCALSDFHPSRASQRKQNLLAGLKILSLLSQIRYLEEIDWYDPMVIDKEALVLDLTFEGLLRVFVLSLLSTTYIVKSLHFLSSIHIFYALVTNLQANQNLFMRITIQSLLFCLPLYLFHTERRKKKEGPEKDASIHEKEEIMRNVLDNICEGVILLDKEGEVKYVTNYLENSANKLTLQQLSNQFSSFELNDFIPANITKCPSINQIGKFDLSSSRLSLSNLPPLFDKTNSSLDSNGVASLIDIFNLYMKPSSELSDDPVADSWKFRPTFKAKFHLSGKDDSKYVELDARVIKGGEGHCDKQLLILIKNTVQDDLKSLLIENEKNIYQENFVCSLSHELRTPLNSNLAFLEQAMDSNLIHSEIKEKLIKPAFVSAKLLFYIVSDVIDYSMILANTLKLDIRSKSLISTVNECFDIFQTKAMEKNIKLNLIIQGEISNEFYTDHKRVSQVLVNLLKNSFRFTTKGSIEVTLKKSFNQNTMIIVKDTGIGITHRAQEKLHESLTTERLKDKIHENSAGIGFGLFISNKLAKLLTDGSCGLDFSSELDTGSKFFFEVQNFVPQSQDDLQSPLKKYQALEKELNLAQSVFRYTTRGLKNRFNHQSKSRVLIVDDEVFNIIVIENFCKSLGISVEKALNGEEAIEKLKICSNDGQPPLRAIFMDINMPVKDGYQATKEIQQMIKNREIEWIPVIGVTAYGSKEKVERGYQSGMVEVLMKPLSKEMIVQALSHYKVI